MQSNKSFKSKNNFSPKAFFIHDREKNFGYKRILDSKEFWFKRKSVRKNCYQDKCCMDRCYFDNYNLSEMVPWVYLWNLGTIYSVTDEIQDFQNLPGGWVDGYCRKRAELGEPHLWFKLSWILVPLYFSVQKILH